MSLTDEVKAYTLSLGADLVGIAPVERFKNAPLRMSPQGLLPGCKSVVVAAIHHPDAVIELDGEPTSQDMSSYSLQSSVMNPSLDDISFWVARFLEERGYRTLPIAVSNIWRYNEYKDLKVCFAPDLAHRYAAVAAGLGQIGWSGLCLTPQFGPRNRFVSIITDAELTPTPMYEGEDLCDRCLECVKTCPTDAFRQEVAKINQIEIGGKMFKFPDTNKWRCAWAENFQLSLNHKIPAVVNEDVIRKYMEQYGPTHGEFGYCLRFCMTPQRRYYQQDYARAPRRKKELSSETPAQLLDKARALWAQELVDVVAIRDASDFIGNAFVHPSYHLPDVTSVISIGIRRPPTTEGNEDVNTVLFRRSKYVSFAVAHMLDLAGYSATTSTRIADNLVAQAMGIYAGDMIFATVLTSAKLPVVTEQRTPQPALGSDSEAWRAFCREAGVDLVGFLGKARYDAFCSAFKAASLAPSERVVIEDRTGATSYHPFVPVTQVHKLRLKSLDEWLPGAQSVIVLGLHYPDAALDIAKVTPAETIGPYAFVSYESVYLLRDAAYKIVKRIGDAGYRATFTFDLTGIGRAQRNCRGMLPDMRSNSYPAMLAGLAYQGVHGYPITPQYGVRQRFLAIVTDMPLPSDPMYAGESVCAGCAKPCLEACPTKAIRNTQTTLTVEGHTLPLYSFDDYACEWAKRYALSGEEGPKYMGLSIEYGVPAERTTQGIIDALSSANWGVQKRHINVAEECLRVCPARGNK